MTVCQRHTFRYWFIFRQSKLLVKKKQQGLIYQFPIQFLKTPQCAFCTVFDPWVNGGKTFKSRGSVFGLCTMFLFCCSVLCSFVHKPVPNCVSLSFDAWQVLQGGSLSRCLLWLK